MTIETVDTSLRTPARVAGSMFLLSLVVPLLNWGLVFSRLIAGEDVLATARNVMASAQLFRVGIANEVITSMGAAVLAVALYVILGPVNRSLALLALSLKLTEAILWAVVALGDHVSLLILGRAGSPTSPVPGQVEALVGLFLGVRTSVNAIPMVFLGLGLFLFLSLLFKSKYVPAMLAGFGALSYALVFVYYALMIVFAPGWAASATAQAAWGAPSVVFEVVAGMWLLIKGVRPREVSASGSG